MDCKVNGYTGEATLSFSLLSPINLGYLIRKEFLSLEEILCFKE